mmetsp:Transcript_10733/g.24499  ORF Transcript_10733/g.24499 Transcript_10733/m.24499 type:complete len:309 (-) Transcript_10733:46-972(-)
MKLSTERIMSMLEDFAASALVERHSSRRCKYLKESGRRNGRFLLVEEDDQGSGCIVRSIAFDSSYSWADDLSCHEGGGCKVAFLVASMSEKQQPRASKKRRTGSRFDFPLRCHRCRSDSEVSRQEWDESVLERIRIKYVDSIQDVVKFLAYAPSLPEALRPEGICLLGLHRLLPSRKESGTRGAGIMELIHVLSLMSDTAEVLSKKKQYGKGSEGRILRESRVPFVVTMNQSSYQATARNIEGHLHQWVDFVACAKSERESKAGKLIFNNSALLARVGGGDGDRAADVRAVHYAVESDEKGQFIKWNA